MWTRLGAISISPLEMACRFRKRETTKRDVALPIAVEVVQPQQLHGPQRGLRTARGGTANQQAALEAEARVAEAAAIHFRSVANQVRFYMLRESSDSVALAEMRTILRDEIELARRQFLTARRYSVIAYEASNHYYYTPLDLAEKILNCHQILEELSRRG